VNEKMEETHLMPPTLIPVSSPWHLRDLTYNPALGRVGNSVGSTSNPETRALGSSPSSALDFQGTFRKSLGFSGPQLPPWQT
jgi:hypothetical protein